MKIHVLEEQVWLPRPRDEVFAFFADAANLDAITPAWLNFQIVSPMPIEMKPGALIDYKLRVRGLPIFWRTEIAEWNPPFHFTDRQLKGPYRQWLHVHSFAEKDGGTLMNDRVEYAVPGWFLEPLVHSLIVKRDVAAIFKYRTLTIRERFGAQP